MKIRIKVPTQLAESLEEKAKKAVEEAKEAVANAKKEKQLKQLEELKAKVDDKIAMLKGKKGKKQKVEEMYGAKDMEEMYGAKDMKDSQLDEYVGTETEMSGTIAMIATLLGVGVPLAVGLVKQLRQAKTPEEKKQIIQKTLPNK
jgi:hypothetical protein